MTARPLALRDYNRIVLAALFQPISRTYWGVVLLLLAGVGWGAVAWTYQICNGMGVIGINHPIGWGTYIANFVFWIGIGHAGTLISAILYLFRVRWRNAIYRSAEAMTVFAVMTAGLFPLIHLGRVWVFWFILPYPNQRYLWPNFKSPLVWDVLAVSTYFTISVLFWYSGLIPDLAAARDNSTGLAASHLPLLRAGLDRGERSVAPLLAGIHVPRGAGDAAGDLGAQRGVLGLRDVPAAGLAQHDLRALLRGRRDSLRPGDGDSAADPDASVPAS